MSTVTALRGAIFDVDGVLVASPHEHAWREALADYTDPKLFTTEFYQAFVAGKPRMDGARATLKRLDVTSRSLIALIEPGSCFAGSLLELALAADRSYMLDGTFEDDYTDSLWKLPPEELVRRGREGFLRAWEVRR